MASQKKITQNKISSKNVKKTAGHKMFATVYSKEKELLQFKSPNDTKVISLVEKDQPSTHRKHSIYLLNSLTEISFIDLFIFRNQQIF